MMQYSRMRKHSSKIGKEEKLLLNDEYWTRKRIKATTYLLKSPVTLSYETFNEYSDETWIHSIRRYFFQFGFCTSAFHCHNKINQQFGWKMRLSSILESRYFLGKYYLLKKCYKLILRYGTLLGKTGFDESKDGQGCQRQYSRQSEEIARKCVQRTP